MPITQKIYRKGEQPLPLTDEERAELEALKNMPDSEIDYSDDLPQQAAKTNWIKAGFEKLKDTPFLLKPKH